MSTRQATDHVVKEAGEAGRWGIVPLLPHHNALTGSLQTEKLESLASLGDSGVEPSLRAHTAPQR